MLLILSKEIIYLRKKEKNTGQGKKYYKVLVFCGLEFNVSILLNAKFRWDFLVDSY